MAKAPLAGHVKTRLVPPLTPDEAAALSLCSIRDTVANVAGVTSRERADGIAVYTPFGSERTFEDLLPKEFNLLPQDGPSLGERLFNATETLLGLGYESVCLINADSPTLPSELLSGALDALAHSGDRVVLGPAEDGGYYLIGLKRAHRRLFADIEWSTAKVLTQTLARASELDLEVHLLPPWYDLDDAGTLARLCDELFSPNGDHRQRGYAATFTRDYLARLIEKDGRERIWPEDVFSRSEPDR